MSGGGRGGGGGGERGGGGGGRPGSGRGRGTRFDDQAAGFDRRAGLGEVSQDVAAAVLSLTDAGAVVLEIGPGTGEIGLALAVGAGRYVGLDLSRPMLETFAARARPAPPGLLVEADGNKTWPVRDASVDLVFSSRAAHLLDADHVAGEVRRVCRSGGRFLVGRVERPSESVRSGLRNRRRALLEAAGVTVGSGRDRGRRLLEVLVEQGAAPIDPVPAARWAVRTSAADVIAGWEQNPAMGGTVLPLDVRQAIIRDLRTWAESELGPLANPREAVETYVVEGVQLR